MQGNNRLNIVSTDNNQTIKAPKTSRREEIRAKFERLWLTNPEQFDPHRNCIEEERIERTWKLILEFINPLDQLAVDLGCGTGILSRRLTKAGATVHAVDAASNALKRLEGLTPKVASTSQDCLPKTVLKDDEYDIVISTEVIAYLRPDEYRLYFAELSRLVHSKGFVICSSPVDFNSMDAVERFANLAETEFKIEKWIFSYHRLTIRFWEFFEAPSTYAKAKKDAEYRKEQILKRSGLSRGWFRMNSTFLLSFFWSVIQIFTNPIVKFLKHNRFLMNKMEKICRLFWDEEGISHAILIGKRRPLLTTHEAIPQEMKHKRQVWE